MSEAIVETRPLPKQPSYIGYKVHATTKRAVEEAVSRIVNGTNVQRAVFAPPVKKGNEYVSYGYVVPRLKVVT